MIVARPRRRTHQGRLPDPQASGHGKRLVYLDSAAVVAEAARGARRDGRATTASTTPTCTAACTRSPRRPPPRSRPHAPRSRASSHASHPHEIVFTCATPPKRSTSCAYSWARANLREGDAIVLTHMEHHANVVPWHILAAERGVELRWIPLTDDYRLDLIDLDRAARRRQAALASPRCRTCSAPSTTSDRSPTPRTRPARTCSSTRARRCPTSRSTCRRGTPTSSAFSAHKMLRSHRHRGALGAAPSCSRRCRRSSAAAR